MKCEILVVSGFNFLSLAVMCGKIYLKRLLPKNGAVMSYDLVIFSSESAPTERSAFLTWFIEESTWKEGVSYLDPNICTPKLQAWLVDMVTQFPAMNGPLSDARFNEDEVKLTDYSIGPLIVYASFRWEKAEQAYEHVLGLAAKHQVGFYDASGAKAEVWKPIGLGRLELAHRESDDSSLPMPETVVIHCIDPTDTQVRTMYEVFSWGIESFGEYLFYGEINSEAVKPDGTGDLTLATYWAQVSVSFETDTLSVATVTINHMLAQHEKWNKFGVDSQINGSPVSEMTPKEITLLIPNGGEFPIDVDNTSQRQFMIFGDKVRFSKMIVDGARTTEIIVIASGSAMTIKTLWVRFVGLCNIYSAIPMVRFTGAVRE